MSIIGITTAAIAAVSGIVSVIRLGWHYADYQEFCNNLKYKRFAPMDIDAIKKIYAVNPTVWGYSEKFHTAYYKDSMAEKKDRAKFLFWKQKHLEDDSFYLYNTPLQDPEEYYIYIKPANLRTYLWLKRMKKRYDNEKETRMIREIENENLKAIIQNAQKDIEDLKQQAEKEIETASKVQKQVQNNLNNI